MENATKALIIAGAVLISILLISVGMMVFNSASEPIDQAKNSSAQQAVQIFNETFTPYLGEGITSQQAKSLISAAIASNSKDAAHPVEIEYNGKSLSAGTLGVSAISAGRKYNAQEQYTNGYISSITITNN